jgi:hypothetical protein
VDKQNNLVFPNAAIFISKIEYDFWMKASIKIFITVLESSSGTSQSDYSGASEHLENCAAKIEIL